jgi:hypothetical protein
MLFGIMLQRSRKSYAAEAEGDTDRGQLSLSWPGDATSRGATSLTDHVDAFEQAK